MANGAPPTELRYEVFADKSTTNWLNLEEWESLIPRLLSKERIYSITTASLRSSFQYRSPRSNIARISRAPGRIN
ncbi:hypothetical protein KIN20_005209 [Parelaphostrongylus tenuis]|uniref:Uncharacterized protein n=1 Tax=Parelaphostrongylus tenuis TaxID=148309 RepID=A0AAD5QIF3_PARTN|nr:hypothetical protein KIN20_005209 [Parelaphostrongylus tenuis]